MPGRNGLVALPEAPQSTAGKGLEQWHGLSILPVTMPEIRGMVLGPPLARKWLKSRAKRNQSATTIFSPTQKGNGSNELWS